jgi:hypothetical protein
MWLLKVKYLRGVRLSLTIALIGHLIFFNRCKEADRMEGMHAINEGTTVEIDLSNASETSFFDIFDSVGLVKLETTPNSIIKEVTRIIPYKNEMFILDATQNSVLRFDNNGKFLTRIQKIGNGPGEYTLLYDININPFSENLELLNPRGELLVFSRDGEFNDLLQSSISNECIEIMNPLVYKGNDTVNKYYFFDLIRDKTLVFRFSGEVLNYVPINFAYILFFGNALLHLC